MSKNMVLQILKRTFWPSFFVTTFWAYKEAFSIHGLNNLGVIYYLLVGALVVFAILRLQIQNKKFSSDEKFEKIKSSILMTALGGIIWPLALIFTFLISPRLPNLLPANYYAINSVGHENKTTWQSQEPLPTELYGRDSLNAYVSYSHGFSERVIKIGSNKYYATAFWSWELPYSLGYTPVGTGALDYIKISFSDRNLFGKLKKVFYFAICVPLVSLLELILRTLFFAFPIMVLGQICLFVVTGEPLIKRDSDESDVICEYQYCAYGMPTFQESLIYSASRAVHVQAVGIMERIGFPFFRLYFWKSVGFLFPKYYEKMAWKYMQVYDVVLWALLSEFCVYLKKHKIFGPEWQRNLETIHNFALADSQILERVIEGNKSRFIEISEQYKLCVPPDFFVKENPSAEKTTEVYVVNRLKKILAPQRDGNGSLIPLTIDDRRVKEILKQAKLHSVDFKPLYLLERYNDEASPIRGVPPRTFLSGKS